jgi:hypothetical protein
MTIETDEDAPHNNRPDLSSYLEAAPIQLQIPDTGKKLIGFLVDESAQGVDVQLRRTQCLVAGDKVHIARNGGLEKAIVKDIGDRGPSTRIKLKWGERLDDQASVAHHA